MRWALIILCLLYCTPVFADEVSDLEWQVAEQQGQILTQQEQIWELQRQMQILMGTDGEKPIMAEHEDVATIYNYNKERPRLSFKLKPGYTVLRRETPPSDYSLGRVTGGGPGLSAEMDVGVTRRLAFNLTFDGTLDRIGGKQTNLDAGYVDYLPQPVDLVSVPDSMLTRLYKTRELTNRTLLFTGGPSLKFRAVSNEKVTLDFSTGFDVLSLQFRSMDKRRTPPYTSYDQMDWSTSAPGNLIFFNPADYPGYTFYPLSRNATTGVFSWVGYKKVVRGEQVSITRTKEQYFGYGPKFGLAASFKPTERLGLSTEGSYTTFLDLKGSISSGGPNFPTEGHAFRLDLGASYEIKEGLSLGAGYRGYLLSIDQSKTKNVNHVNVNMAAQNIRTDLFYGSFNIAF